MLKKNNLSKTKKIKKDKHESFIFRRDNSYYERLDGIERYIDDEIPFDIPDNWEWTTIGELFWVTELAGFEYTKYFNKNSVSFDNSVPIVRARNIKINRFLENLEESISTDLSLLLNRSALTKECLLLTFIGAGIGEVCLYESKTRHHLAQNVAKIEPYSNEIVQLYILYCLMSPLGQYSVEKIKKAVAQPSLSMQTIRSIRVPIPPLVGEKRIVKRIEEILTKAKQLFK